MKYLLMLTMLLCVACQDVNLGKCFRHTESKTYARVTALELNNKVAYEYYEIDQLDYQFNSREIGDFLSRYTQVDKERCDVIDAGQGVSRLKTKVSNLENRIDLLESIKR